MPSKKEKILAIIPARIGSTRLPRKVLLPIGGKPMIQVIYENALGAKLVDEVYVATDSEEVAHAVESFKGNAASSKTYSKRPATESDPVPGETAWINQNNTSEASRK